MASPHINGHGQAFEQIPLSNFDKELGNTSTEVSSIALGGRIVSCSDEWFAPASDLLKVEPAQSMKGKFGPAGALFDGWETRRHNPEPYDWVIIRLGPKSGAHVAGFDVDTANFNGNEAPEVEIFGLSLTAEEEDKNGEVTENDTRWQSLLPVVPCGPSQRHLFKLQRPSETSYTHIKLHMIPDGGIGRFRVYGLIAPSRPGYGVNEHPSSGESDPKYNVLDLAHVLNGGRVVYTSDQHFGVGSNLLLPGRGKDMGDGWETKRSRTADHNDYVVVKLGEPGLLSYAEIDTAHFLGNFPESVELHATLLDSADWPVVPGEGEQGERKHGIEWTHITARTKMGPGKQHFLPLQNAEGKPFSHVKVTMHPDGGIKRVRIVGRRAAALKDHTGPLPPVELPGSQDKALPSEPVGVAATDSPIRAPPLTAAAFASYGHVIGLPSEEAVNNETGMNVNQGTGKKFAFQAPVISTYQSDAGVDAVTGIHLYHCAPLPLPIGVKVLERHRFTTQAFLPMTPTQAGNEGYLVVVALNGHDDKPDLSTLTAFHASTTQGISYHPGVWHHPMIALGSSFTDLACVVNESKSAPALNCDEVFYDAPVATFYV